MKIYKAQLEIADRQIIKMPRDAKLLDVQLQGDQPVIWFLCDEAAPQNNREIAIYGTGNAMPCNENIGDYVATIQSGLFVWHVFDLGQSWPN